MINLKEQLAPIINEFKRSKELCNEFNEAIEYYEKTVGIQARKVICSINAVLDESKRSIFGITSVWSPNMVTYKPIELHTLVDWRKLK